jgi:hypothetical protein
MAQRVAPAIGRAVRFISNIGLVEIFLVSMAFVFYYVSRGLVVERTEDAGLGELQRDPCPHLQ